MMIPYTNQDQNLRTQKTQNLEFIKKSFLALFDKPSTFQTCLIDSIDIIEKVLTFDDTHPEIDDDKKREEISKIIKFGEKVNEYCHEIQEEDAINFYHANRNLHECIDQILNSSNGARVNFSSVHSSTHHTLHEHFYYETALQEIDNALKKCISSFIEIDL